MLRWSIRSGYNSCGWNLFRILDAFDQRRRPLPGRHRSDQQRAKDVDTVPKRKRAGSVGLLRKRRPVRLDRHLPSLPAGADRTHANLHRRTAGRSGYLPARAHHRFADGAHRSLHQRSGTGLDGPRQRFRFRNRFHLRDSLLHGSFGTERLRVGHSGSRQLNSASGGGWNVAAIQRCRPLAQSALLLRCSGRGCIRQPREGIQHRSGLHLRSASTAHDPPSATRRRRRHGFRQLERCCGQLVRSHPPQCFRPAAAHRTAALRHLRWSGRLSAPPPHFDGGGRAFAPEPQQAEAFRRRQLDQSQASQNTGEISTHFLSPIHSIHSPERKRVLIAWRMRRWSHWRVRPMAEKRIRRMEPARSNASALFTRSTSTTPTSRRRTESWRSSLRTVASSSAPLLGSVPPRPRFPAGGAWRVSTIRPEAATWTSCTTGRFRVPRRRRTGTKSSPTAASCRTGGARPPSPESARAASALPRRPRRRWLTAPAPFHPNLPSRPRTPGSKSTISTVRIPETVVTSSIRSTRLPPSRKPSTRWSCLRPASAASNRSTRTIPAIYPCTDIRPTPTLSRWWRLFRQYLHHRHCRTPGSFASPPFRIATSWRRPTAGWTKSTTPASPSRPTGGRFRSVLSPASVRIISAIRTNSTTDPRGWISPRSATPVLGSPTDPERSATFPSFEARKQPTYTRIYIYNIYIYIYMFILFLINQIQIKSEC